ncbi:MAG: GntR family transcriptional regulator [Bacteroidales bacterium]|nr:GntR family transcriptional regulator [Bacteroidales bacterium]
MEFNKQKAIYLQIADLLCDHILSGKWGEEQRIAPVREMAAQLGVNPNTVTHSYDQLLQDKILVSQRGMGYYVCAGAKRRILDIRRKEFVNEVWPEVRKRMADLGLELEDLMKM